MEYIYYIMVAVVAYWIGGHVRAYQIMQNLIKNPDGMIKLINNLKEINESEEQVLPENAIEVETQHVNNSVYAYDKMTGEFLAQAANLHQVMLEAAKRFPGKKFWHPELEQDSQTA